MEASTLTEGLFYSKTTIKSPYTQLLLCYIWELMNCKHISKGMISVLIIHSYLIHYLKAWQLRGTITYVTVNSKIGQAQLGPLWLSAHPPQGCNQLLDGDVILDPTGKRSTQILGPLGTVNIQCLTYGQIEDFTFPPDINQRFISSFLVMEISQSIKKHDNCFYHVSTLDGRHFFYKISSEATIGFELFISVVINFAMSSLHLGEKTTKGLNSRHQPSSHTTPGFRL